MSRLVTDMPERRVPLSIHDRLSRMRQSWTATVQLSVGAGIAWWVASNLIGHTQPFFAPIGAILTVFAGAGQRRRMVVELVLGVSVGILVGEALIGVIGRGAWQVTVIVALAVLAATFLGLQGFSRTQAATSASLLAAVVPIAGSGNPAVNRFVDALVGGAVGLMMTVVIPGNPIRRVDREVQRILRIMGLALDDVAAALTHRDAGPAWTALQEARSLQPTIESLSPVVSGADEVATISPIRWRQRSHVHLYATVVRDLDNAVRDTRVLARRVHTMLRRREEPPPGMDVALRDLSRAVAVFADDLAEQDRFNEARDLLGSAARVATAALSSRSTLHGAATAAQVRAIASDLLYATGLTPAEIDGLLDPPEDEGSEDEGSEDEDSEDQGSERERHGDDGS